MALCSVYQDMANPQLKAAPPDSELICEEDGKSF